MPVVERPDQKVLAAVASLQGHPDFDVVMAWIASSYEGVRDQMESAVQDAALRQLQGAAQALGEILRTAKESREALERLQRRTHY